MISGHFLYVCGLIDQLKCCRWLPQWWNGRQWQPSFFWWFCTWWWEQPSSDPWNSLTRGTQVNHVFTCLSASLKVKPSIYPSYPTSATDTLSSNLKNKQTNKQKMFSVAWKWICCKLINYHVSYHHILRLWLPKMQCRYIETEQLFIYFEFFFYFEMIENIINKCFMTHCQTVISQYINVPSLILIINKRIMLLCVMTIY